MANPETTSNLHPRPEPLQTDNDLVNLNGESDAEGIGNRNETTGGVIAFSVITPPAKGL